MARKRLRENAKATRLARDSKQGRSRQRDAQVAMAAMEGGVWSNESASAVACAPDSEGGRKNRSKISARDVASSSDPSRIVHSTASNALLLLPRDSCLHTVRVA